MDNATLRRIPGNSWNWSFQEREQTNFLAGADGRAVREVHAAGEEGILGEGNEEEGEPECELDSTVWPTFNGVNFYADAVVGEGFHISRRRCFALVGSPVEGLSSNGSQL